MNGKLSNSVLLRLIIPKATNTSTPEKIESKCAIRSIQPTELIALKIPLPVIPILLQPIEEKHEQEIKENVLDKLNKLRETSEFDSIIKGSKLGITAYLKPREGIPKSDLSRDLLTLLDSVNNFINTPLPKGIYFGKVDYSNVTKKINFYAPENPSKVLGSIDVTKFPAGRIDGSLNINSNNAVSNSVITQELLIILNKIPEITVHNETLNIEKEEL